MYSTQSWCNHPWSAADDHFTNIANLATRLYCHKMQTDAFDFYVDVLTDNAYWGEV